MTARLEDQNATFYSSLKPDFQMLGLLGTSGPSGPSTPARSGAKATHLPTFEPTIETTFVNI